MPRTIELIVGQQCHLSINEFTQHGQPVILAGKPTLTVQSGDCTLVPVDDTHMMLLSGEQIGESRILVEADIDAGEGVHKVQELLIVQVSGEFASYLGLTVGEAVAKPRQVHRMAMTVDDPPMTSSQHVYGTDVLGKTPETPADAPGTMHQTPTVETGTTRRRG